MAAMAGFFVCQRGPGVVSAQADISLRYGAAIIVRYQSGPSPHSRANESRSQDMSGVSTPFAKKLDLLRPEIAAAR